MGNYDCRGASIGMGYWKSNLRHSYVAIFGYDWKRLLYLLLGEKRPLLPRRKSLTFFAGPNQRSHKDLESVRALKHRTYSEILKFIVLELDVPSCTLRLLYKSKEYTTRRITPSKIALFSKMISWLKWHLVKCTSTIQLKNENILI